MSYQPYSHGAWLWHRDHGQITVIRDHDGTVEFVKGWVTIYGTARINVSVNEHDVRSRHADFIECQCGHLAVTDSDFRQHRKDATGR